MKKWTASFLLGVALVLGCATTSLDHMPPDQNLLPPSFAIESAQDRQSLDYFLLKMADSSTEKRVLWWVEYRRAALWYDVDPKMACSKWRQLSEERDFPIRELAQIRAQAACAKASEPSPARHRPSTSRRRGSLPRAWTRS